MANAATTIASDVRPAEIASAGRDWQGILPLRRPPVVLSSALLVVMLVQGVFDPIAFIIGGTTQWPNPIPFEASVVLLVVLCVAQAASLLLTTRWPVLTVVVTMAISLFAFLLLSAPTWVAPLQLAVVAALFLMATRSSAAPTLGMLAALIVAQAGMLTGWCAMAGVTGGRAAAFIIAQTAGFATAVAAAAVLGLWWGLQTRRVAQVRAQAEAERRDQEERVLRAREAERARITQELHDVAAQHVAGLLSLTDAALTIADEYSPDALTLLTEARAEARFAAASLFSALRELRGTGGARAEITPDVAQIQALVDFWTQRDVRVHLHAYGAVDSLPAVISTTAYRVAQEAITNAAKHAPGAAVDVTVRLADEQLEVEVVNAPSRRGLPDAERIGLGWGLTGLQERIGLLGGSLAVGPTEQGGWRVHATMPITDAARESAETGYAP